MFFATFALGKRNEKTCRSLFNKFEDQIRKPTLENKLEIYTDGNFTYEKLLPEYFHEECLIYGQIIKIKESGILIRKEKRIVYGSPHPDMIDTTNVECLNTQLRNRLSRLVRKTQCHSKNKYRLNDAIELFKFYWNFMHCCNGKNVTPAMEEGIATKIWTWGNFLHMKLTDTN